MNRKIKYYNKQKCLVYINYSPVTALNYSIMFWCIVWYTSYADFTDLMYVYVLLPVSVCVCGCISSASLSSLCSESERKFYEHYIVKDLRSVFWELSFVC